MLNNCKIYIIGMMGTGKTTIGKILSDNLGFNFFDTDQIIDSESYLKKNSLEKFRKQETTVLKKLDSKNMNSIISTGGGVIESIRNREILKKNFCIHMLADINTIAFRINKHKIYRPLVVKKKDGKIDTKNLLNMYNTRKKYYRELESLAIITDNKKTEDIVIEIKEKLIQYGIIS
tara:strand:+ start:10756 stop:11283 length:528 start_codon:yes stop_codon:yes gene_type:complete